MLCKKCKNWNIQDHNFVCSLYGSENQSLTLKEEYRLRVFENRVLRGNIWMEEGLSDGRVKITA
jgi:hypothetical protein